jgi:hypothetical protein
MALSKQHKMYGAVLGLALAALGADRVFFSSPATADEVASVMAPAESAKPAKRVVVPAANPAIAAASDSLDRRAIAARLSELAKSANLDASPVSDAFTPSTAWVKPEPVAEAAVVVAKPEDDGRARKFVQDHRLTAVMDGSKHGVAVVDGTPLRPGQVLDGFKLVAVSARTADRNATFERNGTQVVLQLQEAAATVAQAN